MPENCGYVRFSESKMGAPTIRPMKLAVPISLEYTCPMPLPIQLHPSKNQSAFKLKRWRGAPLPSSDQTHYDGRNPGSVFDAANSASFVCYAGCSASGTAT